MHLHERTRSATATHAMAATATSHCMVFGGSDDAASIRPGMSMHEKSAASMWHALRTRSASASLSAGCINVCEVEFVAPTVREAYSIAVEQMIQNNIGIGEHAFEGVASCHLPERLQQRDEQHHHVRAIVLWEEPLQSRLACFEVFARHWKKRGVAKGSVYVKLIARQRFAEIWRRVELDGGYWQDMAASPSSLPLGADEGEQVVDAVGEGLCDDDACSMYMSSTEEDEWWDTAL